MCFGVVFWRLFFGVGVTKRRKVETGSQFVTQAMLEFTTFPKPVCTPSILSSGIADVSHHAHDSPDSPHCAHQLSITVVPSLKYST